MKRKLIILSALSILTSANLGPIFAYGIEEVESETVTTTEETTVSAEVPEEQATSASETKKEPGMESVEQTEEAVTETSDTSEKESVSEKEAITSNSAPQQIYAETPVEQVPPVYEDALPNLMEPLPEIFEVHKNETAANFIRRIGEAARKVGQESQLYASVMIAQAILETGSGQSTLGQAPYFNLFGIKGEFEGQSVTLFTSEDDGTGHLHQVSAAFRQYPNYQKSFEDYAKLIKEGVAGNQKLYTGVWKEHASTYQEATKALTGVYATDIHYDQKLNALIEEYHLTEYDQIKAASELNSVLIQTASHADSDFPEYAGQSYPGAYYYADGNCTQYVYNRIFQLGGFVDVNMGNGMDWGMSGQVKGYEVSSKPKTGTAVSFPPTVGGADATYGHVAFVEHIYENGSILISEMNAIGLGTVSYRVIEAQTASTLLYVTPK
ncbi:glucosaminidase domain-containing protein [Enterococcus sp. UD-01]|jgi:flagellum-specific peptidoglycan hydrolase FlgJ|uniref:glucosaminidase domain-containing protein n=1 Tax=Enterococcus sp. UD-01 TaxID=3373911 RepID=UPI0038337F1F